MRRLIGILLLILTIITFSSCGSRKIYSIPSDFREIPYQADKDKYLGKRGTEDADVSTGVYSIQGLSKDEFLCLEEYSIIAPNAGPNITLYMKEGTEELIYKYLDTVEKVVIDIRQQNDQGVFTVEKNKSITNGDVWNSLILQRKNEEKVSLPIAYISDMNNMKFYFDMPCNLIWNTTLYYSNDNKIYWYCGDWEGEERIWYDVTAILGDIL